MSKAVLDASAVLAMLQDEVGAEAVEAVVPDAVLATINLGEVLQKLVDSGVPEHEAFDAVAGLGIGFIDVDVDLVRGSARLREDTRKAGLSLGDRVCLALGERLDLPLLTTDRAWGGLGLPLKINVIR